MNITTPEAMENLGRALCHACLEKENGIIIYLSGDLGAGKTTFVRGFLRAFDYQGAVKSPTYTLVEPYEFADRKIYHFDLYRLNSPEELAFIGIRDYFEDEAFCLLEWPEKATDFLPNPDLRIKIQIAETTRTVILDAVTQRGQDVLQVIQT